MFFSSASKLLRCDEEWCRDIPHDLRQPDLLLSAPSEVSVRCTADCQNLNCLQRGQWTLNAVRVRQFNNGTESAEAYLPLPDKKLIPASLKELAPRESTLSAARRRCGSAGIRGGPPCLPQASSSNLYRLPTICHAPATMGSASCMHRL